MILCKQATPVSRRAFACWLRFISVLLLLSASCSSPEIKTPLPPRKTPPRIVESKKEQQPEPRTSPEPPTKSESALTGLDLRNPMELAANAIPPRLDQSQ